MAHDSNRPNKSGNGGQGNSRRSEHKQSRPGYPGQSGNPANQQAPRTPSGDARFENPYNFIPTSPRKSNNTPLGDAPPAGHHGYHPTLWSGRLSVELTTVTPLLIPDQAREARGGHKTYGLRLDAAGVPYLPPTSLKGALRSAYEAVTNSRMGVLEKHEERLALRMAAKDALNLVPCRVVQIRDKAGNLLLGGKLMLGLAKIAGAGVPAGRGSDCLMYAPWLHRYQQRAAHLRDKGESSAATRYPDGSLPQHGDKVIVRLSDKRVHRSDNFCFQQVEEIRKAQKDEPVPPGWHSGWVYVSGPNIKNKHEERVFLESAGAKILLPLSESVMKGWTTLIRDYQAIHEKDLRQRRDMNRSPQDYLGDEPGKTGLSRHVFTENAERLAAGTLCYATVSTKREGTNDVVTEITALYPVTISRDLYATAPADLLDASLKPATDIQHLSPADRVFGWVKDGGHGQHKGQLRIGAVACVQGKEAIERVGGEQGVPLAILGAPKPAQARFYAATSAKGEPYKPGKPKPAMYKSGQGLRGRKVYLHDKRVADPTKSAPYWKAQDPRTPVKLDNKPVALEWLHASGERSDQNRSVTAWVKPGSTFRFDIEVTNLAEAELGALLWLLTQDDTHHFRLGGGKPLGFGVTRLKLAGVDLRDGLALAADYRNLGARAQEGARIEAIEGTRALIDAYKHALPAALGEPQQPFDTLKLIRAYSHAARGSDLAVHYPRTTEDTSGKVFEWFTNNEKIEKNSLPALHEANRGLAYTLQTKKP